MPEPSVNVRHLTKSRRYDKQAGVTRYDSPVADLVRAIEAEAAARGLTLSRWETSGKRLVFDKRITWAVHAGEKPAKHADLFAREGVLIGPIHLSQAEGATERCAAYRSLGALLENVRALPLELPCPKCGAPLCSVPLDTGGPTTYRVALCDACGASWGRSARSLLWEPAHLETVMRALAAAKKEESL